jgi:alpha-1,3-glucosyltransferase
MMRGSVMISDLLLPALLVFHFVIKPKKRTTTWWPVLLSVTAPPLILIDYGHFQYNCVSLGLTVCAIIALLTEKITLGAILFTLAVNHKQMSLYHAVTFFCYMFSTVIIKRADFFTGFRVGMTILSTLGLMWLPFGDRCANVINRIFPIKRGVFEDKVGTFWYVLDRFLPVKGVIPDTTLARTCAIVSFSMLIPSAIQFIVKVSSKKTSTESLQRAFLVNLFTNSLIFFLFSYHVHEKSILLAVLAAVLLFEWFPFEMVWFITVASFSLFPLLYQEGSHMALLLVTSVFLIAAHQAGTFKHIKSKIQGFIFLCSVGGYLALIGGLLYVPPPPKLPHIYQAGIAAYSFLHYTAFAIYFHLN